MGKTKSGISIRRIAIALALILWACGGDSAPSESVATGSPPTTAVAVDAPTAPSSAPPTQTSSENITTTVTAPPSSQTSTPSTQPPTTLSQIRGPRPSGQLVSSQGHTFPPPPDFPEGPITGQLRTDLDAFFELLESENRIGREELVAVASHREIRTAWLLTDVLRFANNLELYELIGSHLQEILGADAVRGASPDLWKDVVDLLIAWDLPAIPEYRHYKGRLFTLVEPGWEPFFADAAATIDWRWLSWGGVFIDNRPLGATTGCLRGCIPALDDPKVTSAAEGDWYPDEAVVFGVTIGGESRAYPKNQMEVHEMVNDTLGGRRIGMPYCTLCGSAQVYFTDQVPQGIEIPVLRTSGLLSRSNKVMYDLHTKSVFDTFTGEARSGPLREAGVRLAQATVVSSTWGEWKKAHPDTTIVAEGGGLGRSYPLDPLRGRDDQGPIFPVGNVDTRLGVQDLVVGVELTDGTTIAFPRKTALAVINKGGEVAVGGVELVKDGDGLRAVSVSDGSEIPSHQAFWFAWSQFRPETMLWSPSPG